jgi:opacity protein-like surface antigen
MMRYLLAGAALAAIAAPAAARDNSAYFGLEVGGMSVRDSHVEVNATGARVLDIDHKLGVDGDLIAGYDFGMFRAEFEGAHKWAKHDSFDLPTGAENPVHGHTSNYSTLVNAMVDLGNNDSFNFYAGGGAGLAWVNQKARIGTTTLVDIQDNSQFAWQGIAGVRAPVFRYFDVGLKYRYFNAGHIKDDGLRSRFTSHSLLASLIYNFAAEEAPPPPPPATQTCPDGSVILATDACPAPPPPPPPPPPTPERGY